MIQEIREQGIGNGFHVTEAADGFRKDNRLWFGKCETCGERVTNASLTGVWQHKITKYEEYWVYGGKKNPFPNHSNSRHVDYCPTSRGEVHETEIRIREMS
jgi:hypothetical protein